MSWIDYKALRNAQNIFGIETGKTVNGKLAIKIQGNLFTYELDEGGLRKILEIIPAKYLPEPSNLSSVSTALPPVAPEPVPFMRR